MDRYSIFDQPVDSQASLALQSLSAEESAKSPAAKAERDLEATLQLLAERARYLTGASGVSIGLRSGAAVLCRAGAGPLALELGSRLPVNSGLMGESLRLRRILLCDDAGKDSRTTRESWWELGIKSAMVGPLLREEELVGSFELLAERALAFEERDIATLQRLSEMILTALEHFDSATQPLAEVSSPKMQEARENETGAQVVVAAMVNASPEPEPHVVPALKNDPPAPDRSNAFRFQRCQTCGFPVSENRTLCLDCEEAQSSEPTPAFPGHLPMDAGWLQSHLYTMGTLFIAALTVALLVLKLR